MVKSLSFLFLGIIIGLHMNVSATLGTAQEPGIITLFIILFVLTTIIAIGESLITGDR